MSKNRKKHETMKMIVKRVGIITALRVEFTAISEVLRIRHEDCVRGKSIYFTKQLCEGIEVVVKEIGDMGNPIAAAATTSLLLEWEPQVIIFCGIGGGIVGKVCLGDVVVAQRIYYYEPGKVVDEGKLPAPQTFETDARLLELAMNTRWPKSRGVRPPSGVRRKPTISFGVIASGEKVIAAMKTQAGLLCEHRKIVAVDMESFGFHLSSWLDPNRARAIVIRGICDLADEETKGSCADELKEERQKYAARSAAMFVRAFLNELQKDLEETRSQADDTTDGSPVKLEQEQGEFILGTIRQQQDWEHLEGYLRKPNATCQEAIGRIRGFLQCEGTVIAAAVDNGWRVLAASGLKPSLSDTSVHFVETYCPHRAKTGGESATSDCPATAPAERSLWVPIVRYGVVYGVLGLFRSGKHFRIQDKKNAMRITELLVPVIRHTRGTGGFAARGRAIQIKELERVLGGEEIRTYFSPIVSWWGKRAAGYEVLSQGPEDSSLNTKEALFSLARGKVLRELDILCIRKALDAYRETSSAVNGLLLRVHISPETLHTSAFQAAMEHFRGWLRPWNIVLNIRKAWARPLVGLKYARRIGMALSIDCCDNMKNYKRCVRMYRPRFAWTPTEWANELRDRQRQKMLRRIVTDAEEQGITVIGRGVEFPAQLQGFTELGITVLQGQLFGRPASEPTMPFIPQ